MPVIFSSFRTRRAKPSTIARNNSGDGGRPCAKIEPSAVAFVGSGASVTPFLSIRPGAPIESFV
eukprot:6194399-Pleurochrysis_carterae.AAC.1